MSVTEVAVAIEVSEDLRAVVVAVVPFVPEDVLFVVALWSRSLPPLRARSYSAGAGRPVSQILEANRACELLRHAHRSVVAVCPA